MSKLIAGLLVLAGVVGGLYVGIWVCLIGGILDVIEAVKANPTNTGQLIWGLVKAIFSETFGGIVFWILAALGALVASGGKSARVRVGRRR